MLSKDLFGKIHVTPQPVGESVPVQLSRKPENPNQYKLFMRPQELMDTIKNSVDVHVSPSYRKTTDESKVMSDLWDLKTKELRSHQYSRLAKSIEEHGILRPVTIEDNPGNPLAMGQGHHRVVAAHKVEQRTGRQVYIPVVYDSNLHHTESTVEYPITDIEREYRGSKKKPYEQD